MGELKRGSRESSAAVGPTADRICAQPACGVVLASWNKSGDCAKHNKRSDRAERRSCAEPGCGQRLRSDNSTQFCFAHRSQKLRSGPKACGECGKKLNAQNRSGYCTNHFHLGRPSHARAIAKAAKRATCAEPGCQQSANQNGYCRAHRSATNRPSVKRRFCKASGCGALLKSNNESGFCRKHFHRAHPVERKHCQEPGCQAVLGNNNKSGLCPSHHQVHYAREHREAQKVRTAEWRARQQERLAAAERRAWRPKDWTDWPAAEQAIGSMLIENPGIRAREIGVRFDESRSPIRPPETWGVTSWERALSNPGPGATWFSRLRTRLRNAGLQGAV
jgi:hypothetical protein